MRNLMILGMIGVAAFMAGWFQINRDAEHTTIEFNRAEIREDARRAIERGREIIERSTNADQQRFADGSTPAPDQGFPNQGFPGQASQPPQYGQPAGYQSPGFPQPGYGPPNYGQPSYVPPVANQPNGYGQPASYRDPAGFPQQYNGANGFPPSR